MGKNLLTRPAFCAYHKDMKRTISLNTKKILALLNATGKTKAWLGRASGTGRQWVHYDFKTQCPNRADKYAAVFNLDTKDLIE